MKETLKPDGNLAGKEAGRQESCNGSLLKLVVERRVKLNSVEINRRAYIRASLRTLLSQSAWLIIRFSISDIVFYLVFRAQHRCTRV